MAYVGLNMIWLVLCNLVSNALKLTPDSGTVTVAAHRSATMWEIAGTDSVMGIATADRSKIFGQGGPYPTLSTAHEKGTGLGLLLGKDLVERNGGKLTLESDVAQAPPFALRLPLTC